MRQVDADTAIADRFRDVVRDAPDALALTSSSERYTYADLDRWSDAIAADIVARDAPRQKPLAILTGSNIALVPAALGAVKAGHFFVVVDASEPEARIASILEAADASLCIVDAPGDSRALPELAIRSLPQVEGHVVAQEPHELVQLVFTSGTTGAPKGVANRQRGFVERVVSQSATTGRAAGQRVSYTALPGYARATYEIFGSLLNGATLCAFDARSEPLDALAGYIVREQVSILTLTPALFRRFLMAAPPDVDLSSVRKLRLGADVVNVADVEAYKARFPRGCTLERSFNATETGMVLHMTIDHDTAVPGPLVPIGRPRPGVDVWIVGDDGREVADGEVGEMVVRSALVVRGYWNEPELTAEKFTFDDARPELATFRTGDLVKRENGLFYFVGRKDSRLKIRGRRIDPHEVESAIVLHGGVREAVVVGKKDANEEMQLAAYVVAHDAGPVIARDVRAALRGKMPSWMVPTRIHVVDAIPLRGGGKVDREALASRVEEETETANDGADDLERTLIAVWSRVLGTSVGRDDDFFDDLGGESLVAAHLVTEVQKATGQGMQLSQMLEFNTVAKMAEWLRVRPDVHRAAVLVQRGGSLPPLFCVTGGGGSAVIFRELAALLGEEQPLYGLTHHGFDPDDVPETLAAAAACYADAIRGIQPAGPYFVAGYSAGGLLAYETARQMQQSGDRVAFLGLIDTAASRTRASAWKRASKYVALLRRKPVTNTVRYSQAVGRRIARVVRWMTGRGWTMPNPAPPEVQRMNRRFRAFVNRALQPYSGRITLFVARYGWGNDGVSSDLGWTPLCDGNLEVVNVAADHHTIIRDDVRALAPELKRTLEKARMTARA